MWYILGMIAKSRGVVVVTLNYRLGALGFFATEALASQAPCVEPIVWFLACHLVFSLSFWRSKTFRSERR